MEQITSYTDAWQRHPPPAPFAGMALNDPHAVAVSALWLLAASTRGATPGWRVELQPRAEWSDGEEITDLEEVTALLAERLPVTGAKSEALRRHLASELASKYVSLRRLPGDDLVLLMRGWNDTVLRITLAAAPAVEPPPAGTRLPCLLTLLMDLLWVNNNNPVTFRVHFGPRDDETPFAWWARTHEDLAAEGDEPRFAPLTPDELRAALLNVARGGLNDLGADWDGTGEYPRLPEDHVAAYLSHDLLDTLLERVRPTRLHGTGFLPVDWDQDDDEEPMPGTVVLIGPQEVAVLDVDVTC
ncbi:hypothetical protein [Dactylosporangium sp. CA-233914]|uniref:hypothetical protein n=1 Tax=Dactylosporangium sp. CA-233914 TaxID=3239934 RepID=UPI003D8C7467